jgi:type I restriction-modification system DNA methylase subunit
MGVLVTRPRRSPAACAEYKHVVLGLIFLKYIPDAFEEQHARAGGREGEEPTRKTRTSTEAR